MGTIKKEILIPSIVVAFLGLGLEVAFVTSSLFQQAYEIMPILSIILACCLPVLSVFLILFNFLGRVNNDRK
jgi:hypothetical protein